LLVPSSVVGLLPCCSGSSERVCGGPCPANLGPLGGYEDSGGLGLVVLFRWLLCSCGVQEEPRHHGGRWPTFALKFPPGVCCFGTAKCGLCWSRCRLVFGAPRPAPAAARPPRHREIIEDGIPSGGQGLDVTHRSRHRGSSRKPGRVRGPGWGSSDGLASARAPRLRRPQPRVIETPVERLPPGLARFYDDEGTDRPKKALLSRTSGGLPAPGSPATPWAFKSR